DRVRDTYHVQGGYPEDTLSRPLPVFSSQCRILLQTVFRGKLSCLPVFGVEQGPKTGKNVALFYNRVFKLYTVPTFVEFASYCIKKSYRHKSYSISNLA